MLEQVLVVIPTYNEAANVEVVVARVRAAVPDACILVVDDNSPDGTGHRADAIAAADGHVHVLHRAWKDGLGPAYLAGFGWALQAEYDVVVQMDADGSHQPEQIPVLLAALDEADLVLGSRWVPGGSVENWPLRRELLSRGGNRYVRAALRLGLRDATGGFRAWRRDALRSIDLDGVASQGYCFQVDLARRALGAGLRVAEVPIRFVERVEGQSKMSNDIVREAMWRVTVWGLHERMRRSRCTLERLRDGGH